MARFEFGNGEERGFIGVLTGTGDAGKDLGKERVGAS
jgi:hypothetical protein